MDAPRLLRLDHADNVAVALAPLEPDEVLAVGGQAGEPATIRILEAVPFGHKVALERIGAGEAVRKYGEVIGTATAPIEAGRHVHVHNVVSARLPGR